MNSTIQDDQDLRENLAHQTRNKARQFHLCARAVPTLYTFVEVVKCGSLKKDAEIPFVRCIDT